MWLKILTPSPNGAPRSSGGSKKDIHQQYDDQNDIANNGHPRKKDSSSKSKTKTMVQNMKSRALLVKQESSKVLRKSHSSKQVVAEQPKVESPESNIEDLKAFPNEASSNTDSVSFSADDHQEDFWAHSKTTPSPSPNTPKKDFEMVWNDDFEKSLWNDVNPASLRNISEPGHPEAPQKEDPQPAVQPPPAQYMQCDISVLTDDLHSTKQDDAKQSEPNIINLEDVKDASKAALFKAMWCGEIALEAGKNAGVAIYEKSVEASRGMQTSRGGRNNMENASTTTHTTSGSSVSSTNSEEKRLTLQAQQARQSRRIRLQRHHHQSRSSHNNTSNQRRRSSKRQVSRKPRQQVSKKEDKELVMDEESTIMMEEGNDCFLMTKDDVDDLVATFQSITGNSSFCDCDVAKNIVQWFMMRPKGASSGEHQDSDLVPQAVSDFIAKHEHANMLWNKLMVANDTTMSKSKKTTTSFVEDDMMTSDSSMTGRTPKIKNTQSKFVDEDMMTLNHSPRPVKKKMVPIEEQSVSEKNMVEPVKMATDASFQPTNTIRTDDLVVACGAAESGQSKDTIETVIVSNGKNDDMVQVLDSEYGDDAHLSEDEDIRSVLFPDDEATDASQCAGPRHHSKGFHFDIDEEKCHWDHGHYKVNSRNCVQVMPTINEVDIDTIVYENNNHDDDFLSFDLSSITPDASEGNSIGTTGTGEALSPVPTPRMQTMAPKVDLNRQMELNRRLKELEEELSHLQGQYNKMDKSCKEVETRLRLPSEETHLSDWGMEEEASSVEEPKVEEECKKADEKDETQEILLPAESPVSDWGWDGGVEESKEGDCFDYDEEEGVMMSI